MPLKQIGIALLFVLLPGAMLAPVWRLAGLGAGEDDVLYYFPSRVYFHDTITAGEWPWINPWNGLDRPFAADPQSALWYPATWLFAALPPLWAYPLSLWLHYTLALAATYGLLRGERLGRAAACFGAIAFAFSGFMLAHRAHFSMQHSAAWAPLVIWRLRRLVSARDEPGERAPFTQLTRYAAAAVPAALQCLAGHVQIAALTALGTLVLLLADSRLWSADRSAARRLAAVAVCWVAVWAGAAALFAVQLLPTIAYLGVSTRTDRSFWDFVENSWHPLSVINLVLPMFFGQRTPNLFDQPYWGPLRHQVEQFAYPGIVPLLLAALSIRAGWWNDNRRRPWIILLVFSLLLALGVYGPIAPLLYLVPGSNLFRVPARALLLANLAMAMLAALSFQALAGRLTPARARFRAVAQDWTRRPILLAFLLIGLPLAAVALVTPALPDPIRAAALRAVHPWNPAVWLPLLLALAAAASLRQAAYRWKRPAWLALLGVVTVADLGLIGWTIDVPAAAKSPADLLSTPHDQPWLEPVRDSGERLWTATRTEVIYSQPIPARVANTNILAHVPVLTDYGPIQPRMLQELRIEPWGVSRRTAELLADTGWLNPLNLGWVLVTEAEWPAPADTELVTVTPQGWRLYRNPHASGMVFFADPARPGAARYAARNNHAFETVADTWQTAAPVPASPGGAASPKSSPLASLTAEEMAGWPRLVVSRLALPGWSAAIDGRNLPIEPAFDTLLAAPVPPGEAVVVTWSYFPPGLSTGAAVSLFAWAGVIALGAAAAGRQSKPRKGR